MRILAAICVFTLPALAGSSRWARQDQLSVGPVQVLTQTPVQWQRVELKLEVTGTYATPFDPDEIQVDAEVTAPSGRRYTVPAFLPEIRTAGPRRP